MGLIWLLGVPGCPAVFLLSKELKKLAKTPSDELFAPPGPTPACSSLESWKIVNKQLIRNVNRKMTNFKKDTRNSQSIEFYVKIKWFLNFDFQKLGKNCVKLKKRNLEIIFKFLHFPTHAKCLWKLNNKESMIKCEDLTKSKKISWIQVMWWWYLKS